MRGASVQWSLRGPAALTDTSRPYVSIHSEPGRVSFAGIFHGPGGCCQRHLYPHIQSSEWPMTDTMPPVSEEVNVFAHRLTPRCIPASTEGEYRFTNSSLTYRR